MRVRENGLWAQTQPLLDPPVAPPSPLPLADPAMARRRVWLTLALILVAILIGGGWDGYWHRTHGFDRYFGFFTPPHIFIYSVCLIVAGVILSMLLTPRIRLALGPGFRVPWIAVPVPGALYLLGAAITMTGVAGLVFDNFWHTTFGLDETYWSFPHAMIGWSELMLILGVTACRLALRPRYPLHWYSALLLGVLLLYASATPIMGPLWINRSPELVRLAANSTAILREPASQHVSRIYLHWNLTRTNPLMLVLAPLWLGVALAFLRRLDRRAWVFLLIVALWWLSDDGRGAVATYSQRAPDLLSDPANWAALPILIPAILLVVLPLVHIPERVAWLAGFVFGLLLVYTYGMPSGAYLLTPLAAVAALVGSMGGAWMYSVVARPYPIQRVSLLVCAGVVGPALMGMADLYLRFVTP